MRISFHTGGQNKDGDTSIRSQLVNGVGQLLASQFLSGDAAVEYPPGTTHVEPMTINGIVTTDDAGDARVRFHMDPRGNDTWNFDFQLIYVWEGLPETSTPSSDVITLNEGHREEERGVNILPL